MQKIKYHLTRPYITKEEEDSALKAMRSRWLTQGKFVSLFEKKIRGYNKSRFAFLVNSATSGLIAAIISLDLKDGDEIICPSFSFPATANSIVLAQARPIFCDIDLNSFNISVSMLERLITKRTRAIMPVSEFGLAADMKSIMHIAKKKKLFVIEDAACSLGSRIGGKMVGAFGDIGVFSFHPRKIITCGEGGCIVTDSARLAKKIQRLRNHGEYKRRFIDCGFNFRLSDVQAAILCAQFGKIEPLIRRRSLLAHNYNTLLKGMSDEGFLKTPQCPIDSRHVYQSYVLLLSKRFNRDSLIRRMRKNGIEAQIGTYCIPELDYYKSRFKTPRGAYKNASFAYRHTLSLPLYYNLTFAQQEYIIEVLKNILMHE